MSSVTEKKYSTIFANLDQNSYRAMKVIMCNTKIGTHQNKRNTSTIGLLKTEFNMNKYPFALKEKRFNWQTDKIKNLGLTVKGNLKTYQNVKHNPRSSWDGLNNVDKNCFSNFKPKGALEK